MLDHYYGVSRIAQGLHHAQQFFAVLGVQTNAGFVQDVQRANQGTSQSGGQLDALGLSAGKGGGAAAQGQIRQSNTHQIVQTLGDFL